MATIYYNHKLWHIDLKEPEITDVNSGIDYLARYCSIIEKSIKRVDQRVQFVTPRYFFKTDKGLLFEYDVHLENGISHVELFFGERPEKRGEWHG